MNSIGSTPAPTIRSCDTGQWIPYFDSCQLTTTWMSNIRLQTPTLARKCEISPWLPSGADGWVDRQTDGHATTKSLGWIGKQIFSDMGLYPEELHEWVTLHYHLFLTGKYYCNSGTPLYSHPVDTAISLLQTLFFAARQKLPYIFL